MSFSVFCLGVLAPIWHCLLLDRGPARKYGGVRKTAPNVIVDVGGHYGTFAIQSLVRYPNATIVVLEPNPLTLQYLRLTVAGLPWRQFPQPAQC